MKKINKESSALFLLSAVVLGFIGIIYVGISSVGRSYALPTIDSFAYPDNAHLYIQNSPYYQYRVYSDSVSGCEKDNPNYDTECTYAKGTYYNPTNVLTFSESISNYNKIVRFRNYIEYDTDAFQIFDIYSVEPNVSLPKFKFFLNDEIDANFYTDTYYKGTTINKNLDAVVVSIIEEMYSGFSSGDSTGIYFTNDNDYYKTQLAIWYHLARRDMNTDSISMQMVNEMQNYINNGNQLAKEVHDLVVRLENSISIDNEVKFTDVNDIEFKVSDDGNYVESNDIEVSGTPNTISKFESYEVFFSNTDAIIINSLTGEEQSSGYNNGQHFKIRIPIEKINGINNMGLRVNIQAKFSIDSMVSYYDADSDDVMNVVPAYNAQYKETERVNSAFVILKILNLDAETGNSIAGTTIRIDKVTNDGEREKVKDIVTGDGPNFVVLEDGNYIMSQIATNSSYEKSSDSIEFSIDNFDVSLDEIKFTQTAVVDVPDTGKGLSLFIYIIGGIFLVLGLSVFGIFKLKKEL